MRHTKVFCKNSFNEHLNWLLQDLALLLFSLVHLLFHVQCWFRFRQAPSSIHMKNIEMWMEWSEAWKVVFWIRLQKFDGDGDGDDHDESLTCRWLILLKIYLSNSKKCHAYIYGITGKFITYKLHIYKTSEHLHR